MGEKIEFQFPRVGSRIEMPLGEPMMVKVLKNDKKRGFVIVDWFGPISIPIEALTDNKEDIKKLKLPGTEE